MESFIENVVPVSDPSRASEVYPLVYRFKTSANLFFDTLLGYCTYNDIQTLVCDYVNRMFDEERKNAVHKHWFLDDYPHIVNALNAAEGFLGDYWSNLLNHEEALFRVFVPSDFVVAETSHPNADNPPETNAYEEHPYVPHQTYGSQNRKQAFEYRGKCNTPTTCRKTG